MADQLQLSVCVASGREVECAKYLVSQLAGSHLAILTALAAEILTEVETRQAGSAVVLVAGPSQAERVLQDLHRDHKRGS